MVQTSTSLHDFSTAVQADATLMARLAALSSRRDVVAALAEAATERGFAVTATDIDHHLDRHLAAADELDDSTLDLVSAGTSKECQRDQTGSPRPRW